MSRRGLRDDERELWGLVTRAIKPLRAKPRALKETAKEAGTGEPAQPAKPVKASKPPAKKAPPAPARPATPPLAPLGRRFKQKLGRGTEPIDARIDLHGLTQAEAHDALMGFLRRAQASGARVVLVITGKGARADDPFAERGVLKRQVPLWLGGPELRPFVVGFENAGRGHGGQGALYVRLRRGR
jgi:DNA-nicking Smr family endonuclease